MGDQSNLPDLDTLAPLLARLQAVALKAPDALQGPARELFEAIAIGNVKRPWNSSHALALSDYCRVVILWGEQVTAVEREGAVIGTKANPRFTAVRFLSGERLRLAKLLGLAVNPADSYLGGKSHNPHLQALGNAMSRTAAADEDGYLT